MRAENEAKKEAAAPQTPSDTLSNLSKQQEIWLCF
jgi:hypothetical protein